MEQKLEIIGKIPTSKSLRALAAKHQTSVANITKWNKQRVELEALAKQSKTRRRVAGAGAPSQFTMIEDEIKKIKTKKQLEKLPVQEISSMAKRIRDELVAKIDHSPVPDEELRTLLTSFEASSSWVRAFKKRMRE